MANFLWLLHVWFPRQCTRHVIYLSVGGEQVRVREGQVCGGGLGVTGAVTARCREQSPWLCAGWVMRRFFFFQTTKTLLSDLFAERADNYNLFIFVYPSSLRSPHSLGYKKHTYAAPLTSRLLTPACFLSCCFVRQKVFREEIHNFF
jgi:hypothetical protein